nr:tetratricopeptide repeat protein [Dorea formicigenerans]
MNRCDFSSISTCLKNHISESNQMSQPDFLYELFEDFMDDPTNQDFSMDNGLVCRWMTGQAKISPKISAYYSKPSNQEKLAHTIHQNLLPLMSDCNMAIPQIANYAMFLTEQQEPERGISELQKLSGIIKEYHSDDCLDYAKVQETLGTIYLMTANLPQAKTHFKRAFKIYEKIWADEPEMIEAKYQEIQELYPQIGFCIGKNLSGLLTK